MVASDSEVLANEVHDLMSSHYFRVFTSGDVVGVEVRKGGRAGGKGLHFLPTQVVLITTPFYFFFASPYPIPTPS